MGLNLWFSRIQPGENTEVRRSLCWRWNDPKYLRTFQHKDKDGSCDGGRYGSRSDVTEKIGSLKEKTALWMLSGFYSESAGRDIWLIWLKKKHQVQYNRISNSIHFFTFFYARQATETRGNLGGAILMLHASLIYCFLLSRVNVLHTCRRHSLENTKNRQQQKYKTMW